MISFKQQFKEEERMKISFVSVRLVASVTNGGSYYPEFVAKRKSGSSLSSELLFGDDE